MAATVTLSSKFQIVIPRKAREAMGLSAGDELLVLSKPDRVVIVPKPKKFAKHMAGLHRDVWQGAESYLQDERESSRARSSPVDTSGS
jgi:AbrB family looped-hinge helix DNA binding protein